MRFEISCGNHRKTYRHRSRFTFATTKHHHHSHQVTDISNSAISSGLTQHLCSVHSHNVLETQFPQPPPQRSLPTPHVLLQDSLVAAAASAAMACILPKKSRRTNITSSHPISRACRYSRGQVRRKARRLQPRSASTASGLGRHPNIQIYREAGLLCVAFAYTTIHLEPGVGPKEV